MLLADSLFVQRIGGLDHTVHVHTAFSYTAACPAAFTMYAFIDALIYHAVCLAALMVYAFIDTLIYHAVCLAAFTMHVLIYALLTMLCLVAVAVNAL